MPEQLVARPRMEDSSDNRYVNSRQTATRRQRRWGQRRWRHSRWSQQLPDSSLSIPDDNSLAANDAHNGWSVTAADDVRLDSVWLGARTDIERSPEPAELGLARAHSPSNDGILPGRLTSSASSVSSDEQPTCLLCCEPIKVAGGIIWFSRAAVQDLLVLCLLTG